MKNFFKNLKHNGITLNKDFQQLRFFGLWISLTFGKNITSRKGLTVWFKQTRLYPVFMSGDFI